MKEKSVLDDITIATPCPANWDLMVGDDRERFCQSCSLNVYNISSMSRREAEEFIESRVGESVCLRLYRRPDGTIILDNCPKAFRAVRRKVGLLARTVTGAIASALVTLIGPVHQGASAQSTPDNTDIKANSPGESNSKLQRYESKKVLPVSMGSYAITTPNNSEKYTRDLIERIDKPNEPPSHFAATLHHSLARFLKDHGRLEESKQELDKAIKLLEKLPRSKDYLDEVKLERTELSKLITKKKKEKVDSKQSRKNNSSLQ